MWDPGGQLFRKHADNAPAEVVAYDVRVVDDQRERPRTPHGGGQRREDTGLHRGRRQGQPLGDLRTEIDDPTQGRRQILQEEDRVVVGDIGLQPGHGNTVSGRPLGESHRLAVATGSGHDKQRRSHHRQPQQEILAAHEREERLRRPQARRDHLWRARKGDRSGRPRVVPRAGAGGVAPRCGSVRRLAPRRTPLDGRWAIALHPCLLAGQHRHVMEAYLRVRGASRVERLEDQVRARRLTIH